MRLRVFGLLVAMLASLGAATAHAEDHWTRAWTSSLWAGNEKQVVSVADQTLRFEVRVGAGGEALRLWLGNDFGPAPVRIASATMRTGKGEAMPVRFGGEPSARIAIGAPLVSDPVPVAVEPFALVEVTVHVAGAATLVGVHGDGGNPVQISAPGNGGTAAALTTRMRPLIAGIDVLGARERPVVVAFGDSITDASGCANSAAEPCRWSEVLGRRLAAAGKPHVVVNQGIGGNKILTPMTGPNALARLDRDVFAIPGVTHLVLLEGINDIGTSARTGITADDLIAGYRQLTLRAQAHGIKVIAMTVTPFEGAGYYSPEGEAIRERLNQWIRSADIFDGVVDMEKAVADPAQPRKLRSDLQVGDNLHPNAAGQRAMGAAIPLSLFD